MLSNEKWFGASAGFYPETIDQSLRFEDGDSPYLLRTPSSTGNRKTWTISCWFKIGNTGLTSNIISVFQSASPNQQVVIRFYQDKLYLYDFGGAYLISTNRVFRDTTNWYHMVWRFDSTQSTASERIKLYINGTQETDLNDNTYPSLNHDSLWNHTNKHLIGARTDNSTPTPIQEFDGYLAEFNLVDGQALGPESFGELKNGTWIPKSLSSISYGTNGFRLTFADSSSLGDDTSGNGNDFTSSGLASTDVVLDSPTNNFCTLNSLSAGDANDLSQGNLQYADNRTSGTGNAKGTFPLSSGKWYWEVHYDYDNGSNMVGIVAVDEITTSHTATDPNTGFGTYFGWDERGYYYQATDGSHSSTTGHTSYATGDIISFALDVDGGKLFIRKNNGSWEDSANPVNGTNPSFTFTANKVMTPMVNNYKSSRHIFNFGQNPSFNGDGSITAGTETDSGGIGLFKYAPPTDYLAICSANLPDTTISPNQSEQADDHFNTILYTGNGFPTSDGQTISGVGFQPDWTWIKDRSRSGYNHYLLDTNRSATKVLRTTSANAEGTEGTSLTSWNSDGFVLGANNEVNYQNDSFVAWNWKAGGTTPTKTYKVKVVADSTDYGHGTGANKYQFFKSDGTTGFGTNGVDIDLQEGGTYVFDWSDSTAQGHPLRFSLTNNGTHGGGSEYTTGVVKDDSAYKTTITVASGVANLYYYCQLHSGMGAEVRTNTTHGSTNFDGSILSVSQTNETSGFSIVTYTGTGSNGTIGHGLGKVPKWILIKERNGTRNWIVYHGENTSAPETEYLHINQNLATQDSAVFWNDTAPTSSVISLGTGGAVNFSGNNYVAFVFAEIEGYSKFGSYQPNGSTDGTYIHLGFSPSFFMAKSITASGYEWVIIDNKRTPFNEIKGYLVANEPSSESTSYNFVDFLSNGIKIRASSGNDVNASGHTVIYMAFADQPFKFSNAK